MLRKVFPFDAESSFSNSFKIIFVSEGYLATESALFTASCLAFVDKLLETPPFSLTRINSNWLSVYSSFVASDNRGPAMDLPPNPDRTAFGTWVDRSTGHLSIHQQKLNDYLDSETFRDAGGILNLAENIGKGGANFGSLGTLVIMLLPPLSGYPLGTELENTPSEDDYYCVATSQDGEWQQVIIRALCKLIGLADEFESDGDEFLEPSDENLRELIFYPNVQYFESAPLSLSSDIKWYKLLSLTERGLPFQVHQKSGPADIADHTIVETLISYSKPTLWEGAAGYRTKVYRSSKDCLLRREIGSRSLPLRSEKVAFCPVCFYFIKKFI